MIKDGPTDPQTDKVSYMNQATISFLFLDGYRYDVHPGTFYKTHPEKKTWREARDICLEEGREVGGRGDLVIVYNQAINDWLTKESRSLGALWIAASDTVSSNNVYNLELLSKIAWLIVDYDYCIV